MPTSKKIEIVRNISKNLQNSPGIYFTQYSGMNVSQATELRKQFRDNAVKYIIAKNTLTKIAATEAGFGDKLNNILKGQVGIAYASDDPTSPARVIRDFIKKNNNVLEVVGLIFEGEIFDADKYKQLANLPNREVLLSTFVSSISQPLSKFIGTLEGPISKLSRILMSLKEKKS